MKQVLLRERKDDGPCRFFLILYLNVLFLDRSLRQVLKGHDEGPQVDPASVRLGLDQAHRILEHQVSLLQALAVRADSLVRLAIAEMGGIVLVVSLGQQTLLWDDLTLRILLVGTGMFASAGLLSFVLATVGPIGRPFSVGPRMDMVVESIVEHQLDEDSLASSALATFAEQIDMNGELLDHGHRMLSRGVAFIGMSGSLLLGVAVYILGGGMRA